ncbi:hypothetical protein MKleb_5792 (plasmid) [Klebsiella sp. PL-2018]|nr:hypothetical protein MKleb_5792 [Klebsiella sp. PL-2018]
MSGNNTKNKDTQARLESLNARLDAQEYTSRRQGRRLSVIILVLAMSGVVCFVCAMSLRGVLPGNVIRALLLMFPVLWGGIIPLLRLPSLWGVLDREETLTEMRVCEQSGNQEALALFNALLLSGVPLTPRRLKPVKALLEQDRKQARMRERQEAERVHLEAFLAATDVDGKEVTRHEK